MAQVSLTPEALQDLVRLVEFLAEAAPELADADERILEALMMLGTHPLLGRRCGGVVRELVISQGSAGYLASYRFDPVADVVRVLRIRHQREAGYLD